MTQPSRRSRDEKSRSESRANPRIWGFVDGTMRALKRVMHAATVVQGRRKGMGGARLEAARRDYAGANLGWWQARRAHDEGGVEVFGRARRVAWRRLEALDAPETY